MKRAAAFALCFAASLALLDGAFRFLFCSLPNETGWEAAPLYNFESALAKIPAKTGAPRVVIAGSSLAAYGFLPALLRQKGFDAVLLAHQGMHGVELGAHWRRYAAVNPDTVVIPVNMVDLRIERPLLLAAELEGPARTHELQRLCQDLAMMYGVVAMAGRGLLEEFSECVPIEAKARILLGHLESYRLRALARPGFEAYAARRFSRGRSYEHYSGVRITDPEGRAAVTHRGHVTSDFVVQAQLKSLDLEILAAQARVEITCGEIRTNLTLPRGWRTIAADAFCSQPARIRIEPSVYFDNFADSYAARLTQNTGGSGLRGPDGRAERERRREDDLYEAMSESAYRDSFARRNLAFDRPGFEYLRALYEAKVKWAERDFDRGLPAVRGLALFVKNLRQRGIRVVVVNAPENPLTLSLYGSGRWYRGYLAFLSELGGKDSLDLSDSLPMQMFYDYHHPTFTGAERSTRALEAFL